MTMNKTTRVCPDCTVPLVEGANWTARVNSNANYRCHPCNRASATVSNLIKAAASERLGLGRGIGGGTAWMALPLATRQAEMKLQRQLNGDNPLVWAPKPKSYTPGPDPVRRRGLLTLSRPGQSAFRRAILDRDQVCVVTGSPVTAKLISKGKQRTIIQAAHIKPVKLCGPGEYFDLDNGLAMRVDMHAAFDHALFTIDVDGYILTSYIMAGSFPTRILIELTQGQRAYLRGHNEWCRENWRRWSSLGRTD